VGFALRCRQRFSRPDDGFPAVPLARQLAHRRSVRPGPLVLGAAPLSLLRPRWIETELSHDVLNPARVPL